MAMAGLWAKWKDPKFRRDDEPVHVDQYLRVENRRHEIVMMTKAANDLANNPRHALILRGVNHMSVALGRLDRHELDREIQGTPAPVRFRKSTAGFSFPKFAHHRVLFSA